MTRIAKIRIVIEYEDEQKGFSALNLLDEGGEKDYPIEDGHRKMIMEADLMGEITMNLGKSDNLKIKFVKD